MDNEKDEKTPKGKPKSKPFGGKQATPIKKGQKPGDKKSTGGKGK